MLFSGMWNSTEYALFNKEEKGYKLYIAYKQFKTYRDISFFKFVFNVSDIEGVATVQGKIKVKTRILFFLVLFFLIPLGAYILGKETLESELSFMLTATIYFLIYGGIDFYFFKRKLKKYFVLLDKKPPADVVNIFPETV